MSDNKRLLPAYPLFVKDPYFSVWHSNEIINESETSFWTGKKRRAYGLITANEKTYCFLGNAQNVEKLNQTSVGVTAFRTVYTFECEEFGLKVAFFSPLPITDYEIWSCPVTYLEYKIEPKTKLKGVSVYLSLHEEWCYYSDENKDICGDCFRLNDKEVGWFGLNKQQLLNRVGDKTGAEWGYWFTTANRVYFHNIPRFTNPIAEIKVVDEKGDKYLTACNCHGEVSNEINDKFLIAYDDRLSVNYFGQALQGYFFSNGKTINDALVFASDEYERINTVCEGIENDLEKNAKPYGEKYLKLLQAIYRQVVASHKLVKDKKGTLLLLSKNCGGDGAVSVLETTYLTMPMLLLYNPELVKASIEPIFEFAKSEIWKYDFAPRDAGVYPNCNGQIYGARKEGSTQEEKKTFFNSAVLPQYYFNSKGGDFYDESQQMPVEDCSNIIIICLNYLILSGDTKYIEEKMPLLTKWCDYLVSEGLIPKKQFCSDDLLCLKESNINLAIKSVIAINAFAKINEYLSKDGSLYSNIAKERAKELEKTFSGRVMPFAFGDSDNTFSIKYNLAPSKLLKFDIFSEERMALEYNSCLERLGEFGFPLDNKTPVTSCSAMLYMASLIDDKKEQKRIISVVHNYLINGADRVPFSDIYDCNTGISERFTNRPVVASAFIFLLKDKLNKKIK